MATSYDSIYQRAVFRFRDYDFMKLEESSISEVLENYLRSAIADFSPVCLENLSDRDDDAGEFHIDLPEVVQEILASGIAYFVSPFFNGY